MDWTKADLSQNKYMNDLNHRVKTLEMWVDEYKLRMETDQLKARVEKLEQSVCKCKS